MIDFKKQFKAAARDLLFLLARLILVVAIFCISFAVASYYLPPYSPKPTWTSANGATVPPDFLYLMFPAHADTPVYDQSDGNKIGFLTRAIANSQSELDASSWIKVQTDSEPAWLRREDLRFDVPSAQRETLAAAYAAWYHSRPWGSQWKKVSLRVETQPDGSRIFHFRRKPDDDHYEEYVYRVAAEIPKPLEIYRVFEPAQALAAGFGTFLIASLTTCIAILFYVILTFFRRLRRKRRSAKAHLAPNV